MTEKELDIDILTDLHVLTPPNMKKWFFVYLSVCLYVCMYVLLASARTVERILFLFGLKGICMLCRCTVNTYVLAQKIWSIEMVPKKI